MTGQPTARRLARGYLEQRGKRGVWFNRFPVERLDTGTGEIRRGHGRMKVGEFRSRVQAEAALTAYLAKLDAHTLTPGPAVTFAEAAAHFEALRVGVMRVESRRTYAGIIRRYLLPELGEKPLTAVDATALQRLIAQLHQRNLSRATIESARNRALEVIRHAGRHGFATCTFQRGALRLPSTQSPAREARHFSTAEVERILAAARPERRALFAVMGYGGLRVAEALGLTWEAVDLAAGTVHVRAAAVAGRIQAPKTRRSIRSVPMVPRLLEELRAYRAVDDGGPETLLFHTRTGRPYYAGDVRHRWLAPLLRKLGLPHGACHAFRHHAARYMDELGLSSASIRAFLGHHDLHTQDRYTSRAAEDLRAQIAAALARQQPGSLKTP